MGAHKKPGYQGRQRERLSSAELQTILNRFRRIDPKCSMSEQLAIVGSTIAPYHIVEYLDKGVPFIWNELQHMKIKWLNSASRT